MEEEEAGVETVLIVAAVVVVVEEEEVVVGAVPLPSEWSSPIAAGSPGGDNALVPYLFVVEGDF